MLNDRSRCDGLFTLLQSRCDLFIRDIDNFKLMSEDVIKYIRQYLEDKKYEEAIHLFNEYIDIHIPLMHQIAYLRNGICSFQYQIDERDQDCPRNNITTISDMAQELSFERQMSSFTRDYAYERRSEYLTHVSIEYLTHVVLIILNYAKLYESLKALTLKIDEADVYIKEKVRNVQEILGLYNVTNNHSSNWNQQKNIGPFDIFHYKYNFINQKQEVRKSEQFDRFQSYHDIRDELKKFNSFQFFYR